MHRNAATEAQPILRRQGKDAGVIAAYRALLSFPGRSQPPTLGRALGFGGGLLDFLDLPVDCALGLLAARLQCGTLLLTDGCGRILKSVDSSSQIH